MNNSDLIYRLRKRAEIRRTIPHRKSVIMGEPDRISELLEEAAAALEAATAEPQIDPVDEYRKGFIAGQIDMRDREQAEPQQDPVAWRTFDGEGGWDYRTYEGNEDYHELYIARNGSRYAHWVEPLYNRVQKILI